MAPRGRPRKVGQTRMDAAIDALSPLGFSESFIRRRVNDLLKVYDGEWMFIEDCSYKVLIDTIMEEEDEKCMTKDNEATKDGDFTCDGAEPNNAQSHTELFDTHEDDGDEPSGACNGAVFSGGRNSAEPDSARTSSIRKTQHGTTKHVDGIDMVTAITNAKDGHKKRTVGLQEAVGPSPTHRRKPCYGWIGDDDEDDLLSFDTATSERM